MACNLRKKWSYFKEAYKRKSFQYLISISFTAVALVGMIFLGISLYSRFISSAEKIIRDNNKRVIDQVNLNLDGYLRNMRRVSDSMYYRVIKNSDLAVDSIDDEISLLYDANKDLLVSIVVVDKNGKLVSTAPLSKLKKNVAPNEQQWFQSAMGKIENMHFSIPHVQNLFEDPDFRYRWIVSLSRAVELTRDGAVHQGVLLVDMNFSGIEQLFKDVNLGGSGYIYLISGDGDIIYHPRHKLLYSNILKENNVKMADYDDGTYVETFEKEKRVVTVKSVGYTGWKIIGVTPIKGITANYLQIQVFAVFILLFTIFLIIFVNQFVSSKIADPIKKLGKSVKSLEEGNFDTDIAIGGPYEIQHLGRIIQSMVTQMRKLMDDIVVEQESKRKSELDALQSQINPHFLYNTLDSIVWMIENERFPEAIKMVTSLARLFRISLSKGNNRITVKDELEHAQYYLTIQMMRYKNKFTVQFETDPAAMKCTTIKLIVQPLLENSIYHAMELMDGDGEITVKTYFNKEDLYIDVVDNGDGMPKEVCENLLNAAVTTHSKGSGLGLSNVNKRIQLAFGEQYGLEIISRLGYGTTARIRLPCINHHMESKENDK